MVGRAASPLAAGKGGLQRFGRAGSPDPAGAWGMEQNKFVMNHENMKIYVGDGVLDVPEGPRNEMLLRDIWQGFGTVKTVPYG